jgi:hypothetical protein
MGGLQGFNIHGVFVASRDCLGNSVIESACRGFAQPQQGSARAAADLGIGNQLCCATLSRSIPHRAPSLTVVQNNQCFQGYSCAAQGSLDCLASRCALPPAATGAAH